MKVRAAVLEAFGEPLAVQDVDLAEPHAGEVLVRLEACGVCHTDLYTAGGADPSGYAPTVLGHEGAGIVEALGPGVESVAVGDRVVTLFSPQCRECVHCRSPKTNLCLAIRDQQNRGLLPDGTTRLSRGREPIRHFMGTSAFAEATVLPEIALAKVDRAAPADVICTLACGATTGIGAALYVAGVKAGSTCAVFGAGLVGLGAVAGCRLAGAERIICVDLSEDRLAIARAQGATETFVGAAEGIDVVERILELTGGFGADYTFEATGSVAVMRQAVEAARMGWGGYARSPASPAGARSSRSSPASSSPAGGSRAPRLAGPRAATGCPSSRVCTWTAGSTLPPSSPAGCRSTTSTRPSSSWSARTASARS